MAASLPGVTVVTVTRGRPELLTRAAQSVQAQEPHSLPLEHIIVGDECPTLDAWSSGLAPGAGRAVRCCNRPRSRATAALTASARCSMLRMWAVDTVASMDWVAFMDDDTIMLPHHLSSLLACARAAPQRGLAHSHRVLFTPGGGLFGGDYFPWALTQELRSNGLKVMQRRGIIAAGCPLMFDTDQWDSDSRYSGTVDGNEWLMSRALLQRLPWPADISPEDEAHGIFEDGKFLRAVRDAEEPVRCSHLPSLAFQVGGRSNVPAPGSSRGLLDASLRPYAARCALMERLAALQGAGAAELALLLAPTGARLEAEHFGRSLSARGLGPGAAARWALLRAGAPAQTLEAVAGGAGCGAIGRTKTWSVEASGPSSDSERGPAEEVASPWLCKMMKDVMRATSTEEASIDFMGCTDASSAEERVKRRKVDQRMTTLLVCCVQAEGLHGFVHKYFTDTKGELQWPGDLEGALVWYEDGADRCFYDRQDVTSIP